MRTWCVSECVCACPCDYVRLTKTAMIRSYISTISLTLYLCDYSYFYETINEYKTLTGSNYKICVYLLFLRFTSKAAAAALRHH